MPKTYIPVNQSYMIFFTVDLNPLIEFVDPTLDNNYAVKTS